MLFRLLDSHQSCALACVCLPYGIIRLFRVGKIMQAECDLSYPDLSCVIYGTILLSREFCKVGIASRFRRKLATLKL